MGNTGGDNRVEFGTRGDHVVVYNSPTWAGFSFDAAYQFGQQLDPNSDLTPLGSLDCNGSNNPGSGNLFLNCDDGGYDRAYSADLKFEMGGLYLVGAYEIHKRVNRTSDGIGANSPYYNYLSVRDPTARTPICSTGRITWPMRRSIPARRGRLAGLQHGGRCRRRVGDEVRRTIRVRLRSVDHLPVRGPASRSSRRRWSSRTSGSATACGSHCSSHFWDGRDVAAVGWAHAGATVGDPGGQHNYNPTQHRRSGQHVHRSSGGTSSTSS